jgi:hypothetical protein
VLATLGTFVRRLADPTDTRAGCAVAAAVLLGEAVLTAAIIMRVPCGLMRGCAVHATPAPRMK